MPQAWQNGCWGESGLFPATAGSSQAFLHSVTPRPQPGRLPGQAGRRAALLPGARTKGSRLLQAAAHGMAPNPQHAHGCGTATAAPRCPSLPVLLRSYSCPPC